MKPSRTASCMVIMLNLVVLQCEPLDEERPPATPAQAGAAADPPAPPTAPPPPAADAPGDESAAPAPLPPMAGGEGEATGDEGHYASDEYTIGANTDGYEDDDPAALTDFHATLEPYGTWADDPRYGTIWTPSSTVVGADFSPYVTAGHWVYDDDWVWASDYEWGWAPFHYGRWIYVDGRGWAWVPGRAYRGAWVTWGVDDGYAYVGWAPLAPSFVWLAGVATPFAGYVGPRWVYCPRGDVFAPILRGRLVVGAAAAPIAMRVRPFVSATPGVVTSGPPPQKLGFQSAQLPHATGPAAAGLVHAQEFSRPATAQTLGARAPARVAPTTRTGEPSRDVPGGPARSNAIGHGQWAGAPGTGGHSAGTGRPSPGTHPTRSPSSRSGDGHPR